MTTTDERLTALRDGIVRFARGSTPADADELLARIIANWNMRPEQLPDVVATLGTATGRGPNPMVMWLDLSVDVVRSAHGRMLIRLLAAAADGIEASADQACQH